MTNKERKANNESKRVNPCLCGCGEKCLKHFKQGHDQRVRGILLRAAEEGGAIPKLLAKAIAAGVVIPKTKLQEANQPVLQDA
jgi:hypothetical protein